MSSLFFAVRILMADDFTLKGKSTYLQSRVKSGHMKKRVAYA